MPQAVFGNLLQLVCRPMAEIQRSSRTKLEGVARSRDVVKVEISATINQPLHRRRLELAQQTRVAFYSLEKILVANECYLHSFDVTRSFIARGKKRQQLEIVNHGERRSKCADEILLAERVNAIFDPNARIVLAQGGAGHAHMAHAAVRSRRRQAHHVQQRASAYANHVGMAIDMMTINPRMNLRYMEIGGFRPLTALNNKWRTDQIEAIAMPGEVGFNLVHQTRLGLGKRLIHHDQ